MYVRIGPLRRCAQRPRRHHRQRSHDQPATHRVLRQRESDRRAALFARCNGRARARRHARSRKRRHLPARRPARDAAKRRATAGALTGRRGDRTRDRRSRRRTPRRRPGTRARGPLIVVRPHPRSGFAERRHCVLCRRRHHRKARFRRGTRRAATTLRRRVRRARRARPARIRATRSPARRRLSDVRGPRCKQRRITRRLRLRHRTLSQRPRRANRHGPRSTRPAKPTIPPLRKRSANSSQRAAAVQPQQPSPFRTRAIQQRAR